MTVLPQLKLIIPEGHRKNESVQLPTEFRVADTIKQYSQNYWTAAFLRYVVLRPVGNLTLCAYTTTAIY
jgi:hypothetical protein